MKAARKKIWGWYFFDWATQPYSTLMLTFVFGPFFATIASEVYMTSGLAEQAADAKAQSLWSLCLTIVGADRRVWRTHYGRSGRYHRTQAALDCRVFHPLRRGIDVALVDPTRRVEHAVDALCIWGRLYRC